MGLWAVMVGPGFVKVVQGGLEVGVSAQGGEAVAVVAAGRLVAGVPEGRWKFSVAHQWRVFEPETEQHRCLLYLVSS